LRDEYSTTDPLRSVFAEMRTDLDAMIDGEIARLYASSAAAGARGVPGARPIEAPVRSEDLSGVGEDRPSRPPMDRLFGTAPISPSSRAPLTGPGAADDAGSRLVALARRLEGRLNRPRRRAGEPNSQVQGGEVGDDRNGPSSGRDG
jgi:hypothetical protein